MQQIAWQLWLVLMTLVALGFAWVAINSGHREEDYTPLQKRAYRLRTWLFWGIVLLFGPVMIYTLMDLPYTAGHADNGSGEVQVVDATGYQWRWELSRDHVVTGQPVEFRITSADVNHGFGIYDANLHLVAQTQAMPGYTNTIRHTFSEPGTYRVLCREYCGVAHHNMMSAITVENQ